MAKHVDDPVPGSTAVVVVVFALAVAITLIALQGYFGRAVSRESEVKVVQPMPEERARIETEQRERLSGYRWVDREVGVVSVPIDRAMELVVQDLAAEGGAK